MSLVVDLVDKIDSLTSLTTGTDLFVGFIPLTKSIGIAISDAGGIENWSGMQSRLIQITAIYHDYITTESKCRQVFDALVFNNGFTTTGSKLYFQVSPMSEPKFITLNDQQKPIFTASIVIHNAK